MIRVSLILMIIGTLSVNARAQLPDQPLPAPQAIAAEAVRLRDDALGRPLPLASHWNTGTNPRNDTFDPGYQIELIEHGHHLLPFLGLPDPAGPKGKELSVDYYQAPIKRLAQWGLPLSLISTQWESKLTNDKAYFGLPSDTNPNVIGIDGKIRPEVDPMGPVEPWRKVGKWWTASEGMQQLIALYPHPAVVILVSNNEHTKLQWTKAEESKRYVDQYGTGRTDAFKRQAFADGWVEHYGALLESMREGLANPAWSGATRFIGYGAFGPRYLGRWYGWKQYSFYAPGRIDWSPLVWDGSSPPYYVDNWNAITDYTVFSPQIESMNWVFMQQKTAQINKNFWFEISTWDGNVKQPNDKRAFYASKGQTYNPERYAAMVRFGMWLLMPRVVREFRGWTEPRSVQGAYFLAVVDAVDEVHNDPTLRRFWRKGTLVPNRKYQHPYQVDVPDEYRAEDRWFLLDTNLDPKRPWTLATELPVFALAITLGKAGAREWLVYAHAPLGLQQNVEVTVPDYGSIKVNVPPSGAFYLVAEQTGKVTAIERKAQPHQ